MFEENFRSIKTINWCQKVWTPNQHPHENLLQAWKGSKSICLFWIRPTEHFNNTRVQASGSMNANQINANKTSSINYSRIKAKSQKESTLENIEEWNFNPKKIVENKSCPLISRWFKKLKYKIIIIILNF